MSVSLPANLGDLSLACQGSFERAIMSDDHNLPGEAPTESPEEIYKRLMIEAGEALVATEALRPVPINAKGLPLGNHAQRLRVPLYLQAGDYRL